MYINHKHAIYQRGNPIIVPTRWELIRDIGKDVLSPKAQLKLEWIIFYYTVGKGNVTTSAKHFGITRKTLHKWLTRFVETRLETLEENSRAPRRRRQRDITPAQRLRIIRLRKAHLRWGKMKLRECYAKEYGATVSSWKIQKVIEESNLYFEAKSHHQQLKKIKQAQINPKRRITEFVKEHKIHYLWHVDTVLLTLSSGGYRYLLTAIDEVSKLAYAKLYTTHSSKQAADFLKRLHYLTEGEMINLHHDNGSEFEKDFKKACLELALPQWYSRVRTPKDNAVLERFNRTIQEEFVDMAYNGIEALQAFNQELTEWLIEYNSVRPHQALDYLTPLEYIDTYLNTKVLPMSSSHTSFVIIRLSVIISA
jgi:transposase InsO family protein